MTNQSASSMIMSLKQMVKYCRDIQGLLNADQKHFSTNAIESINESNKAKVLLVEKLNTLVNDAYSSAYPNHQHGSILEAIEKSTESLTSAEKREVNAMLLEFKSEIAKAYESILTNSKIVFANTQQLRSIWDNIQSSQAKVEAVYDNKGYTTK